MTNQMHVPTKPNLERVRFSFSVVDDTVNLRVNDEDWQGTLTYPANRGYGGINPDPMEHEFEWAADGASIYVQATDTGGREALVGTMTGLYADGSTALLRDWNHDIDDGSGSTFVDEEIVLRVEDSPASEVTQVVLKFTQIDDEVQVFHNDSQDPVWKHGILRHTDEAQTHTLELQGGANKLEVKAFNDIGSASLFGSITYSYADRTETHVWEDNAGHHVPRRPEPFEHYVHEFQH